MKRAILTLILAMSFFMSKAELGLERMGGAEANVYVKEVMIGKYYKLLYWFRADDGKIGDVHDIKEANELWYFTESMVAHYNTADGTFAYNYIIGDDGKIYLSKQYKWVNENFEVCNPDYRHWLQIVKAADDGSVLLVDTYGIYRCFVCGN